MKKILKIIIIFAVIAGLGYLGYSFIGSRSPAPVSGLSSSNAANTTGTMTDASDTIGNTFLDTLLNLRTITLNAALFTTPSFKSLTDYSTTLNPEQNVGRPNPFAAVGAETTAPSSAKQSTPSKVTTQ